jgi:aryl-alcohol dehydrogenase-like predicted oxidoreductase
MHYIKLGSTGLDVSPIAIGAMTYGEPDRGHPVWSKGETEARPLIRHALEAGINFFDTANMYSNGSSEEILGRALKDFADRDTVVIATKLRHPMRPGPNGRGLSRKAILTEVDHSLRRLGTDYIDLYQIHRNDHSTPWEETLEALSDLVKAGKVRYLGASSMHAWEYARSTARSETDGAYADMLYSPEQETSNRAIIDAVGQVAQGHGVSRAQIALAWLRRQPVVTAPLVGAGSIRQIDEAVGSLDVELTDDDVHALEAAYTPRYDWQGISDEAELEAIRRRVPGMALS